MDIKRASQTGEAFAALTDHGGGRPLTWDQCESATLHLARLSRDELLAAATYLAVQLVTSRRSRNADAELAMHQVARIVHDFENRHGAKP